MKTKEEILSRLKEHESATPSRWRENAEWRMANKSWLRYSQRIAMMMLDRMGRFWNSLSRHIRWENAGEYYWQ